MPWELTINRTDLADATLTDDLATPEITAGQVLLRISLVGMTANNVTYAVLGDSFRYWEFFPTVAAGRGLVPLWGYASVVESTVTDVAVGDRFYGYLPSASHLVVTPGRVSPSGFRDVSEHRATLPSPYHAYQRVPNDALREVEALEALYRPLFTTSWMLADSLAETPAEQVVFSSASSKTAYGAAFLIQSDGTRTVGLTSPGNVEFTKDLGVYDEVLAYPATESLHTVSTAYADLSGDATLRSRLRAHLGPLLVRDAIVGVTHAPTAGGSAGSATPDSTGSAGPGVFFAPERIEQRLGDWGRADYEQRYADASARFSAAATAWVDIVWHSGPEQLRTVWLDVLAGSVAPSIGPVLTF